MLNKQNRKLVIYFVIALACLVTTRGFMTSKQLAGHDTTAYQITQHQFHKNIADGVLIPRWAPDMRFGYGHIKLQFRPPLLHYLAEPFYAYSGNPAFAINMAVIILVFIAGFGAYACCRSYMNSSAAMLGAVAYISFNYLLSDMYIRGAYYEVAAYAFMPWILWAQASLLQNKRKKIISLSTASVWLGIFWAALICSHPQIMVLFLPLEIVHFFFMWNETRNGRSAKFAILATLAGFLLAAPYWFVAWRELQYVRMQLFYTGLESYTNNFISLKELLFETYPKTYSEYISFDFLGRPKHLEARSLNFWAIAILLITPCFWFVRNSQKSKNTRTSIMFYLCCFGLLCLAFPVSRGVWYLIPQLHTFNFPWRVLAVVAICITALTGLTIGKFLKQLKLPAKTKFNVCLVLAIWGIIITWNKSIGWDPLKHQYISKEDFQKIDKQHGIPDQFYTPKWVRIYAPGPALVPIRFISGKGRVNLIKQATTSWEFSVDAKTNAKIAIAHYYYPGWTLLDSKQKEKKISPLPLTGEISFDIPPGSYELKLEFKNTLTRNIANAMTVCGIVLLLAMFIRLKPKNS